ncbi:MAG: Gfo/Idh/MocA family oxidoreductase [Verrucomicrobiota bacterium]
MAERLRCAVIGAGAIGLDHLASLARCPRATTVAIAESSQERGKEANSLFRIPRTYADYEELLEQPDIDAVTIALPNYLHAKVAIQALQARKHVLLEKPMATNARDAAKIIEVAKKMKRIVMVAQNFRFDRHTQIAKVFVERGDLGEIYHARCFWHRRSGIPRIGSWFTQKNFAGGGCTYDIGVHMLDTTLHLLGDFNVGSISGQTYAKFGPRGLGEMSWGKSEINPLKPFDVDDSSVALIKLKAGRTIVFESSWAGHHAPENREYGLDLLGTEAGLSLFPARLFRNGSHGYESIYLNLPKLPHPEDRVHHFVSCVLDGKMPLVPLEESLQVQRVLDAIYTSSATGKEVKLS